MPAATGEDRKPSTNSKVKDLSSLARNEAREDSKSSQSQRFWTIAALHKTDMGCTGLRLEDRGARAFAMEAEKAHGVWDGDRYANSSPGSKEQTFYLVMHLVVGGCIESNLRVSGGSGYSGQPLFDLVFGFSSH